MGFACVLLACWLVQYDLYLTTSWAFASACSWQQTITQLNSHDRSFCVACWPPTFLNFWIYLFSSAVNGSAVWPSALDDKMSTQGEIKCTQCHERLNVDLKKGSKQATLLLLGSNQKVLQSSAPQGFAGCRCSRSHDRLGGIQLQPQMVKLASLLVIFSLILTGKLSMFLCSKSAAC